MRAIISGPNAVALGSLRAQPAVTISTVQSSPMVPLRDGVAQGKLVGASAENGCRVLGVTSPGLSPNSLNLDVTFAGCRYSAYNRRFSGTLSVPLQQSYARLNLVAY